MKESEIRPKRVLDEFFRLLELDAAEYFSDCERAEIPCPACSEEGVPVFKKSGFGFSECPSCLTLFATPRPPQEAFSRFYRNSSSAKYWATTFYKETEAARKEKLWKPKARQIQELTAKFPAISEIVDVGGGYGAFADEFKAISTLDVTVIEPSPLLAETCRKKGLTVIEKFLESVCHEDLSDNTKCFVSFELFEHLHNPSAFLLRLADLSNSGDLFIFTTLSGLGVDIQAFWENSQSISPPQHLNFFNPNSIRILLEKSSYEVLEVLTPGKLDLDIMEKNSGGISDRFWRNFIRSANAEQKQRMQTLISDLGYSSHMMTVCRKR